MASIKLRGIVLGGTNVKEKDKIINFYSLERGKMALSMRGVRGDKAKLKSAKEIFCFGDFLIEEGKTNIVTGVDIIDNFYDISSDIDKYYEGCAILNIVSLVGTTQPNPPLFIEIIKALKTLCYENVKKYYIIDKFLLSVFAALGYQFLTDYCSNCANPFDKIFFNLEYGELLCSNCSNAMSISVSKDCFEVMKKLAMSEYENLKNLNLSERGLKEAFNLLCKNFEFRTGYACLEF